MKPELRFETKEIRTANLGETSSVPDLLGELILQNHLEFRLDEEDEIYEGYGRRPNAYPYRQYNGYTRKLSLKQVKTAVLENDVLKAVFLPEYGGRLWELWDKENGRNLLYTNDVLQFSNLAVRNAWFSGGVEWNIGIIGHNPMTTDPLYVAKTQTEQGEPVLRMYEYERIRKVPYQMDFWLEEGGKYLNCRMRIVNESSEVVPMYWWSNIAVPEYDGGRILVPANEAFTYEDGAVFKVQIPMVHGVDVTDYKQIPRSVDYFFDIPETAPKYIANVDAGGYGLLQMSTNRLRSRKLFSWGNQDASDKWQEFLTDKAGRYTEIQAGLGKTQYGCIPMAPHTAWEWVERYGAVSISREELAKSHKERSEHLTRRLQETGVFQEMDTCLAKTKNMAKTKATLVESGSGYGALKPKEKWSFHLEFTCQSESLERWKQFWESGVLHTQPVLERPDEFLINEENLAFLETHMEENKENWYAWYHLGLGRYVSGEYERAKEALKTSLSLEENPWAYHALACACLVLEEKQEAAACIQQGIGMKPEDISYLKEGLKILSLCEAYEPLKAVYEQLKEHIRETAKLKFYYIQALEKLGETKKAYQLLEADGGLEMEDIREGEDSLAQLWSTLYESLYGEKKEIPHRYNFKAY